MTMEINSPNLIPPFLASPNLLVVQDVFLRELVSNAADACDKKRFLALTNSDAPPEPMKLRINSNKATP